MIRIALSKTAAIAAASLFAAGAAYAQPAGMTVNEVADIFRAGGLSVELDIDGVDEPMIVSETLGYNFALYAFNCEGAPARCREFLFSSWFETDAEISLATINAFNARTLAGRAYIDAEGDIVLEHLFTASSGGDDLVSRNLAIWETSLEEFVLHIGFAADASS